jgi:phospholipid transport system transporter-binding protein
MQKVAAGQYAVSGVLSLDTVATVRREALRMYALDSGPMSVDLAAVSSADSGGLALLVDWLAWASESGRELHYRNVPAMLLALARISDVSALIEA